jgi:hypothetical protein
MRYAVASNFEGGRAYFTGAFGSERETRFRPVVDPRAEKAFAPPGQAAARAVAEGLTDLHRFLPPFRARTWFVVELPDAAGYAHPAQADLAGAVLAESGLPR